jgi:lysophospholipase L1-like esterase
MELAIVGALLALGAYGLYRMRGDGQESEPPPPAPTEPVRVRLQKVSVIGDSLAVGLGKRLLELAELDDVHVDFQAKVGSMTGFWVNNMPDLTGVDVLVVVLGTNDAAGSGKAFESSMTKILEHASLASVPVVWVEPTGVHLPSYGLVSASLGEALAEGNISAMVDKPTSGYAKDNVHLSTAAYRLWADRIWDTLTNWR